LTSSGPKQPEPRKRHAAGRRRRGGDPAALGALLANARATTRAAAGVAIDRESWRRIVGARIAERTEPGMIRAGVLTVSAASAVWVQELSLLSDEIVMRLRAGGFGLHSIRFRVTNIARRKRAPDEPAPKPPIELPEELATALGKIDDLELRETIASAAAFSLALPEPATSTPPAARAPRSAESESVRSDRDAPAGRAASRRNRGGRSC
jgi:hypothetical protein